MNDVALPPALAILDVAAGSGMLGLAVKLALHTVGVRAEVVGGVERDACAAAVFLAGMGLEEGRGGALWDDARTFLAGRARGVERVDVLVAGYPCQPFSQAGRRRGGGDPRHLWPAIRRLVPRLEPDILFLENVDGHVTQGLRKVLRDAGRLGYRVTAGVFSAEEVGAPHGRKRVFILGIRHGELAIGAGGGCGVLRQPPGSGRQSERGDAELADADQPGLQGGLLGRGDDAQRREEPGGGPAPADGGAVPLFPPGRGDEREPDHPDWWQWARLLEAGLDPTLMPATERGVPVVADGMAPSADLLRLGGNGVVPLQAAWAFLVLFCCLMDPVEAVEGQGDLFADLTLQSRGGGMS